MTDRNEKLAESLEFTEKYAYGPNGEVITIKVY